jgi:hypothetical protein
MKKQFSFARGEIAPALYARVDLAAYAISLRTLRNFFIGKAGGAYNRPGMSYLGDAKADRVRLIEFIFSESDSCVLEFGHLYMRIWRNGAREEIGGPPGTWTSSAIYSVGDLVSHAGINYYCVASNTNTPPPNAGSWHPLSGEIYEIPTPFTADEIGAVSYAQSADVMVFAHHNHPPQALRRLSTRWTLGAISFGPSIAAPSPSVTPTGIIINTAYPTFRWDVTAIAGNGDESLPMQGGVRQYIDPISAPIAMGGWNPVTGAVDYKIYRLYAAPARSYVPYVATTTYAAGACVTYGGLRYVALQTALGKTPPDNPAHWRAVGGWGYQTGLIGSMGGPYTEGLEDSGQPADVAIAPTIPNPFIGAGNYPAVALFSQQRLLLANTENNPEGMWASRTGSVFNFAKKLPITDDDPIQFTLVGPQVSAIRALAEVKQLIALTATSEWAIKGDGAGILLPTAINAKVQSYNGASALRPLAINGTALYVQAMRRSVWDLSFTFEEDGYAGNDLSIFSSHLFETKTIEDWAAAKSPNSLVWVVLSDGSLASLTYVREHDLVAWARHDTDGEIESVAVVPEGGEERAYFAVKRGARLCIERMESREFTQIEDAIFLDSALSYDGGSPVASVSGLEHLEGREVAIFADGHVIANPLNPAYRKITVSGGAVSLGGAYSKVHVGLPYVSDLETLGIDSFSGEKKIVTGVRAFIEGSRGFFAGPKAPATGYLAGLTETKLRTTEAYNEPIRLHTEEVLLNFHGEWSKGGRVFIRNVDPLPLTVLSINPQGFMGGEK